MAHLPKHLSGDPAAINEFIEKFDVRWSVCLALGAKTDS